LLTRAARQSAVNSNKETLCFLAWGATTNCTARAHTPRRTMPPMDEARRARLQAKLDAETLKGTLANKVRTSPMTRRRPTRGHPPPD